jgi:ribonuclease T1
MRRPLGLAVLLALVGVVLGSLVIAGRTPAPPPAGPSLAPRAAPEAGGRPAAEPARDPSAERPAAPAVETARTADVPQRARDALAEIRRRGGEPPPGHVGGRTFQNRERRLPRGVYREYDVNPRIAGRPRDAERLVIEQKTGTAYYTADHYETFVPIDRR